MLMIVFTGLSGAGKSTLAIALQEKLAAVNYESAIIDGDVYRNTICKDLGFSEADRRENIRRLTNVAIEKKQAGIIPIIAAINPFDDLRRELCETNGAILIYIKCSLEKLIQRDTKGLYKKALLPDDAPEKIWNLTGVNDRYDVPSNAGLIIDTGVENMESSAEKLFSYVKSILDQQTC
jgi:adenylyl-sulfate kinase